MLSTEMHLYIHKMFKSEIMEKCMYTLENISIKNWYDYTNIRQNKLQDTENYLRLKEGCYIIIKGSDHQEDI